MSINYAARFETVKEEVTVQCVMLLGRLREFTRFPSKFTIIIQAQSKETGETASTEASVVIPRPINYKTRGRLTGKIGDHQLSVTSDGQGHFKVTIDDKKYPKLPQKLIEEQLGIPVQTKKSGAQSGYPSEPLGRAVWRHLADRYNVLDRTVSYFDEFIYYERNG